jgi:serine/threonine protein kinase
MDCLTENELLAWARGGLPDERVRDLDRHVDICEPCRSLLAEALRDSSDGGGVRPPREPRGPGENTFATDELVAERYRVARLVARGGMGEVYEVEDQWLHHTVALKTLLAAVADDDSALARLKAEVLLARHIAHPNVCRVFDFGFTEKPRGRDNGVAERIPFLTMEYLAGETLAARIRRTGCLSVEAARPIVSQMLSGLAVAHAAGIVHRDFKSDNVMLVPSGDSEHPRVVVADFGLARSLRFNGQSLSSSGHHALGTLDYMAPEQLRGCPATRQSDVYAVGTVMFEMLTGRLPFGDTSALARALLRSQSAAPRVGELVPGIPPKWERVIARCLERNPSARFSEIAEIAPLLAEPARRKQLSPRAAVWLGVVSAAALAIVAPRWSARRSIARTAARPPDRPIEQVTRSPLRLATTPADLPGPSARAEVAPPHARSAPPARLPKRARSLSAPSSSPPPAASPPNTSPSPPQRPDPNRLLDPFAGP